MIKEGLIKKKFLKELFANLDLEKREEEMLSDNTDTYEIDEEFIKIFDDHGGLIATIEVLEDGSYELLDLDD